MRPHQPTMMFAFTVLVGLARLLAYAGTSIGQGLSLAALLQYVAMHILTFAFAAFLVAALSRATATRAAFVALYAQAVLFLAPFVDVGAGAGLVDYAQTYTGVFGGSPGSIVAVLGYGAVVAWGVRDATIGLPRLRSVVAVLAGTGGVIGTSLLAIPWPRLALLGVPAWSLHLALASYFSILAAAFLALAIRQSNPAALRAAWRQFAPVRGAGFAVLPFIGVVTAGRLIVPQVPNEPVQRLLVEAPYVVAAVVAGAALWVQWSLVRADDGGPMHLELAAIAKGVALAFALPLGVAPFLASAAGGSAAWLGRAPSRGAVLGILAASAVLVGGLSVVAVDFSETALGPATFVVPLNQNPSLSIGDTATAAVVGVLVALLSHLTSRTSASGRGRASS